jgi:hypothetical protein
MLLKEWRPKLDKEPNKIKCWGIELKKKINQEKG